jgi:hypothetical protein
MTSNRVCQKCGAAPAVPFFNLATAANAAPDAPDFWVCVACFRESVNEAQAEQELVEHRDQGGQFN